jgi:hypothetical protein
LCFVFLLEGEKDINRTLVKRNMGRPKSPEKEIKVITQNSFFSMQTRRIIKLVKSESPDIFCLQEITGKRSLSLINRLLPEYDYTVTAKSPGFPGIKTLNATFSKLPTISQGELHLNRKKMHAGVALWTILKKHKKFAVYNCYLSVSRQGFMDRGELLETILKHANALKMPAIVCGDMNTVIPKGKISRVFVKIWHRYPSIKLPGLISSDERYYFYDIATKMGFKEAADIKENTWCFPFTTIQLFGLKLDWMLYKGFSLHTAKHNPWMADHRGINAVFSLD